MSRFELSDVDAAARARLHSAAMWAGGPGFVLGALAGLFASTQWGWPFLVSVLGLGILLAVTLTAAVIVLAETAGAASRRAFMPSGSTTPARQQFSRARSLEVRERFDEAIEVYRCHIEERPGDPEPYVRIARIHRDDLDRPEEALRWLKAARDADETRPALEVLLTREIVSLYTGRLKQTARAAPELARAAERWAGTPDGEWAARELAAVKNQIREDGHE